MEKLTFDELIDMPLREKYVEVELPSGTKSLGIREISFDTYQQLFTQYETEKDTKVGGKVANRNLMTSMIAMAIFDPPLDDEQRKQIRLAISKWPSSVVMQVVSEINDNQGFTPEQIQEDLKEAENFFGQNAPETEQEM
jgi:hypothetical protein